MEKIHFSYSHKLGNPTYWTFLIYQFSNWNIKSIPATFPVEFKKLSDNHNQKLSRMSEHHRYKLAANTMSLLIALMPSLNLFSKSVLPMFFAAWHSCRRTSSNLRMQRIMLPEQRTVPYGYEQQARKDIRC
jgi:hypothetical protein